ncbi:MAG: hypothetical protein QG657_4704, partial [Acidobacteriota bacterium]|nr:hypothetical protein [Acidobacteriota bacterium]
IKHKNFVNLINFHQSIFEENQESRMSQVANPAFDAMGFEVWPCLASGAALHIADNEILLSPIQMRDWLIRRGITISFQPTVLAEYLLEEWWPNEGVALKSLCAAGDKLSRYPTRTYPFKLYNLYGPTEDTVWTTWALVEPGPNFEGFPSIGKPVANHRVYILNSNLILQPVGVPGELCISGVGLAEGYLNNPGLTAERFIKYRSYGSYKTYIIYKTGDLARWLDDGNIEFLGRIDHQVKIRGQRIELGEIENQLLEHENIKEAVINCLTDKTGGKSLCAYIVCDHNIPVSQLREYLLRHLPGFMVPANYVILDKIPVTANGKVDRNALPDPEGISLREDVAYTLPSSPVEKKLVEIWQEVLGRKNISIDENFFMIGGDSIRSIQVISRMSGAGYKLEMKDLFQYPAISKLAPRVTKLKRIPDQSVITGTIPLTPIQRMLFQQSHIDPHHYNQAVMFYSKSELEKEIVRKVFTKIQEHHDALRMTYKINPGNDGNGVNDTVPQINHGLNYPLSLDEYDLRNRETGLEELNMKVNEIQASIDFENGPLMKLGLFHMDDGDRLLIVIHHMVIDGVSWRILFEDIETLYNQYRQGKSFALPAKSDSFKLWSEKQSVYANSKIFLKEKNYWKKLESFESLVPQIPKDYQEVDNYFKDGVSLSFSLTEEDTERLLTKVNEVFKTEINDILLTALGMGIKRTFGQERVSIALEGHGREEILEGIDISRTVGWFTSVYPVLLDICYPDQPGRQIKEIKETLRRIPNKGMGYGILKYLSGEENKKEIEFKLKPQISFNYLGQFDTEVKQISSFEIAKESAGNPQSSNNKQDYLLDVSGIVTNNRLTMTISYNKTHFKPDTITPLLRNFETELINIIAYCCAKEEKEPTPSDFTYQGLSIENIDRLITLYPNLEDLYTLSPMQEGMLFHALADDSSYSYFEQASYRLQGELEIHLVKKSLDELFKRHDILRTAFVYQDIERPVQLVLRDRNIDFYYQDISNLETREAKETFISEFKANDKNRSFDLSKDVLMRVAILQVENSEYEFTWSFHHILMDGWCLGILNSDFFEIYNANRENIPYRLPGINPYRTYIMWLEKKDNEESTRYWQNYLDSFEEQTGIPTVVIETSTKEEKRYRNEMVSVVLDMEKTAGLNKLAVENNVTLNIVTQTLWGILLGKYNGREDVVFGTVVSGRPSELEGVESMVGLFINTIPVRIHFEYKMKFYILVQQVQREALDSEPHHYHPLPEIQALTTLKQNLIDHIFVFENYPIAEQIKGYEKKKNKQNKTSIKLDKVEVFEQTNYDFNVILGGSDRLSITFQYNGNVYNEEFIERIVGQFCTLVDQVIKKKELEVGELTLLSEEEKNRILYEFNNTAAEYPKNKTIHQLFKEQAERIPDNIALVGAGSQTCPVCITYHQLDTQSDQLARLLIEKGVLPDTIVAIMMEPSVEMIIGIMGILKSGGAYLPIDLEYPRERIDYMLADSNAKVLLGMEEYWNKITVNCQLLIVNCKLKSMPQAPFHHSSFIIHHSGHLAYIIYTSGSTGRPKGVMINHKSFTDFTTWAVDEFEHRVGYQVLLSNSFASDGSIQQIFPPLISGGVLHVITKELRLDVARYLDYLKVQRVNNIDEVPVLMKELVSLIDPADPEEKLPDLTCLSLGSEYVPIDLIRKCRQHINHHGRIINAYGPAEASVETTTYHCDGTSEGEQSLIGKPRRNIKVYILDKRGQCCPIGVQGEICVGGVGLARGYLNQPELTAERFKFNRSYRSYESYILYKTGDMGRWLPDGNIEFIGRIDNQVKIRGFRVELAEIENRLLNVSGVKEALVLEGGEAPDEKYLCAYFVSTREFKIAEFRGYLAKDLPDYMIPSYFMRLEKIPLTPNGKIDRGALPKPKLEIDQNYTGPRDDIEKRLVKIWSEILSRGEEQISIGIDDNFFRLGGHSLKATIMMSKIHKELNVKVELMNIFRTPTIRDIAQLIRGLKKEEFQAIEPVEKKEYYPLSSAQKRLFFLQQLDLDSISYNIPMVLPLGKEIKADKLEYAFKQLINRHESLRTSIERVNDVVVQRIHESVEFEIEYFAADAGGVGEQTQTLLTNFIRPFDYSKAPLIRSGLIMLPGGNCVWIVDIHHIVSDGTSHTILTEDFLHFYETGMSLEPLPIQYKDFAQWQNQLFASGRIKDQEDYWMQLYSGEIPRLNLATDYKRPVVFTFQGDYHMLKLEREDTVRFKALGARHGGTLYMNIMAALNTLFYKYTGQTDIILGSGIAGRQHADIQGVVGMFVNTLAMRNYPDGQKPYETFLAEVIANSIKGFENQDVQFEELVDKLDPERDPSRNPLFDILMVVQNFREVDSTISLEQVIALDEYSPAIEYKNPTSKFDLTFFVHEQNEDVYIYIEYYTGIFKLDTIRRLDSHFKHVVKTVIAEPTIKLREIEIISEEEKQQVLFEFNDTIRDYPWEKSIPVLFEEQVERTPDHIALVGVGLRLYRSYLTYRELHEQSNRLANYLYYGNRVAPDQPVGIMMNRSLEMITAVLAILKAGAAYTPISPSYPLERIKKMINDAGIKILLSQKRYIKNLNRLQWECGANLKTFFCIDSSNVYGEEEAEENQLMSRKLWEYVGETAVDEVTGGGWNSSYTGEPIPKEEMDEYGDNVLRKLESLLHKQMRVLEIGSASGISMYRIAPRVGLYFGTDISGVIIEKNKRRIMEEGHKNIKLLRAAAHEIDRLNELGEKDFDLVIINSVIQCFHGHNYLRNVIRKAIDLMGNRGYLFIGDIMDQDLKEDLITDMMRFKHENSGMGYKTKTDWSEELFISRSFLEDLAWDYPEIYDMEFSEKIHTIENELTRFRYDALIKIDRSGKERKKIKRDHRYKTGHDLRELKNFRAEQLGIGLGGDNLAYVIYTSGSTGIPKGVMVDHRNVVRLVKNANFIELRADDRILQTGALEFDASTLEIWGALLNGLVLVLESKENILEAGILKEITTKHKISLMWMTSSFFNQVLDEDVEVFKGLRYLLVGGEALSSSHINRLRSRYPKHNVINGYGPTENTTFSTTLLIDKEYTENIPIGRPIANSLAYVLDRDCNLLPPGVAGELYVGGEGVARGYLNSPELTSEKFKHDLGDCRGYHDRKSKSFFKDPGTRGAGSLLGFYKKAPLVFYKTGDLARWLSNGVIEFLGRIDSQVKIRGYRIEMQEIENRLLKVEQVKEAVVIDQVDTSGSKYLCAYVVIEENSLLADLRDLLSKDFPDYMIPTYFIPMKAIPLTANGKVDRRALPGPEVAYLDENAYGAGAHKAPRNEIENKLVEIWHDVLSLPHLNIGIEDNFFELGGHSLKATILVSKIHKEFDVKVPLAQIFKTPSIMGLAEFIRQAEESRFFSISTVEKKEYYALSSAQKRIYILQQMETGGTTYNMPAILLLEGVLDRDKFESIFERLIQRHESLRTSFYLVNDAPVQKIDDKVEFEIEYTDLATDEHGQTRTFLMNFIRPFELSKSPLLRVGVAKEKEDRHILMVDMHHIISDGTSINILVSDFMSLYQGDDLPELMVQYKDFSEWQNSEKQKDSIKRQEDSWIKKFEGEIPVLALPLDYARPSIQSFEGGNFHFEIDKEASGVLKKLTLETDTTMYMVLLALYTVFLSKVTGQEDIVVGTPIAGRRHTDLEKIIGMFVNTLALRNYPSETKRFTEFLQEVKEKTLSAFENQDYQFEDLVERVVTNRDISRNPLFDVMFVLQNIEMSEVELSGLVLKPYGYEDKTAKFDLTLTGVEATGKLFFTFEYSTNLFREETINRFSAYFKNIVNQVIDDRSRRISDIEIITAEEKKKVLYDFNDTEAEYPKDKTIYQLFTEQAERIPDNIALVGAGSQTCPITLSYNKLNEQSDRLAVLLLEKGVLPDNIVGIMMERSAEMIIAILGILKSGGAYMPIDPAYPQERIDYMLKDSNAKKLAVANDQEGEKVRRWEGERVLLGSIFCDSNHLKGRPRRGLHHSNQVAYIIYTSGSTGKPKGVMVEQQSVVNYIWWAAKCYVKGERVNFPLYTSISFDLTVTSIYTPLITGNAVVIYGENETDKVLLIERIIEEDIVGVVKLTPSHLKIIKEKAVYKEAMILKRFIVGGEILDRQLALAIHEVFKGKVEIYNEYGPTEATVGCMIYKFDPLKDSGASVPIGIPGDNSRIYILDKYQVAVPTGVTGELYISGAGIARGYLNRPELTAERFIEYRSDRSYKTYIIYKTGDLARWLPDGNIEFFGRVDQQVKIRGYRIELGEIENCLLKASEVKEAVVLARTEDEGNKYLCAYIVGDSELGMSELRKSLVKELPDYMIPSYFVQLEKIPLTTNGKVDRKALPRPEEISLRENVGYTLPSSDMEKKLVEIWEKVLGRNNISTNENFFMLGGDSIKAIQIISRMSSAGYKMEMKDLFQYPVIANLAPRVKKLQRIPDQSFITGTIPLTPIQASFFTRPLGYRHHYNHAVMLYFAEEIGEETVRAIFSKIQEHHDALRMSYIITEGRIIQTNHGLEYPLSLQIYDLRAHENAGAIIGENAESIEASIDLEKGPMMKLGLFHCQEGDYLLIVIHHLVIDGISWRILFEDIDTLYHQFKNSAPLVLPPKTDSFKFWSEQQVEYAQSSLFLKEKNYWGALEQNPAPIIKTDFAGDNFYKDTDSLSFILSEETTTTLLGKVNEALGTEINDILLTALGLSISSVYGINRVLVALEGHGREKIFKDIDITRTVGWFTSVYPVILDMSYKNDLSRQIKEVKEHLHQLPHRGIGYGILKYLTDRRYKEDIEFCLNPQICFNYLGQFDTDTMQSTFAIANQPMGNTLDPRNQREYQLDVSGMVSGHCLTMSIDYSKTLFKKESIEKLSGQFKQELLRIISHCTAQDKKQLTPSDFAYKNLSFKDLNEINKLFNKN